jgi:hypothetical protein
MPLTRLQAIKQLSQYVQSEQYPELDNNQLGNLIDSYVRFSTWTASTAYKVGDIIVPQVPNGRMYMCIVAGTSNATQPDFPQVSYACGQVFYENPQQYYGQGYGLTWQDSGFVQVEKYDVRAAAKAGWLLKASIAANLANTNDGKMKIDLHQIQENCIQMAAKFRSFAIL